MANAMFDQGRQDFLAGAADWDADNFKCHLLDAADHTTNLATNRDLADITAAGIEEVSANLASKTTTDGTADAADITFTAASGDSCEEIHCYRDSGVAATSSMIFRWDTATGLPVTLNGGDVDIQWNASGLATL